MATNTIPTFGNLKVNAGRHPIWPHVFNPYNKNRATHLLDNATFDAILSINDHQCDIALDHLFAGCIDAPDAIPMGSTECISTVGGFEREEYRNLPRGTTNWKQNAMASAEMAEFLKELLADLK